MNRMSSTNSQINIKLRERFCRVTNVPIKIYLEPYFSNRLELLNPLFNCKSKYETFVREVNKFDRQEEYLEFYNTVKESAIQSIKETEAYKELSIRDMDNYIIKNKQFNRVNKQNIYNRKNHLGAFISIDIRKANFEALRHFNDSIVGGHKTYEEFITQFCGEEYSHIINSKYIRQVILGNCAPKRQNIITKYLVYDLVACGVLKHYGYEDIESITSDEIIIRVNDKITAEEYNELYKSVNQAAGSLGIAVEMETFTLHNIEDTKYYFKRFIVGGLGSGNLELKCVTPIDLPLLVRELLNEEEEYEDRIFVYDNMLVRPINGTKIMD